MNGTIAILCSGQGTQHAGMFDLVAQAPEARSVLDAARALLDGKDPQQFVREADQPTLFSNHTGQILCCTQALAAWAMIHPHLPGQTVLAGYSVGELAAWGCAGLIEPAEVLKLAADRARMMDEAGGPDAGLAAVIGLDGKRVGSICHAHGVHVAIANREDFFVVGGKTAALDAMCKEAIGQGATKAARLRVAVAAHTPLLADAAQKFGERLNQLHLPEKVPAGVRLLSGIDGAAVFDVREGCRKLAAQISQTLQWGACLDSCRAVEPQAVLELGPGHALTSMATQLMPQARVRSVDDFRTPSGVTAWIGS